MNVDSFWIGLYIFVAIMLVLIGVFHAIAFHRSRGFPSSMPPPAPRRAGTNPTPPLSAKPPPPPNPPPVNQSVKIECIDKATPELRKAALAVATFGAPEGWTAFIPDELHPSSARCLCHNKMPWLRAPNGAEYCGTCHPQPWNGISRRWVP